VRLSLGSGGSRYDRAGLLYFSTRTLAGTYDYPERDGGV